MVTTRFHVLRLLCAAMIGGNTSASLAQATRNKCTFAIDGDTVGSVVLNDWPEAAHLVVGHHAR